MMRRRKKKRNLPTQRDKRREHGKEKRRSIKRKKKREEDFESSSTTPSHEPLQLEVSINTIKQYGAIKEIAYLYDEMPPTNKPTIEKVIVMYMMIFNVSPSDIIDQFSKSIVEVLSDKRKDVVVKEAKMRQ